MYYILPVNAFMLTNDNDFNAQGLVSMKHTKWTDDIVMVQGDAKASRF